MTLVPKTALSDSWIGAGLTASLLWALLLCQASSALATVLYDANAGQTPELYPSGSPFPAAYWGKGETTTVSGTVSTTSVGGVVPNRYLDFSSSVLEGIKTAYAYTGLGGALTLDPNSGYQLGFRLQMMAESHSTTDRAGFSFIAIGSDPTKSLELAFWTDHVWAYSYTTDFAHGALDSALDTTLQRDYLLQVQNGNFTVLADGNNVLTGSLQNYTPSGNSVYLQPNNLVFGDDTTRASSNIRLSNVTFQPLPETSSILLFASGAGLLSLVRRRRAR